ncbi:MAG: PAS domain S-box protein [Flavobacteriales bacterium]|nr:PAS domain S-box protein [Flavobacteriales bacterium]
MKPEDRIKFLERENELLNSIIQGASDSIYAKDVDGRYITINEAGASYLGLSVDEVIGKTDNELLGEEGWKYMERDENLYKTGESLVYETQSARGTPPRIFSTSKSPLYDTQGKIIGLIGVSRDITEAKLAEDKYQFIFDNAPIAFWEEDFSAVKAYLDALKEKGVLDFRRHFMTHPESLDECIQLIRVLNVNRATVEMTRAADKNEIISQVRKNFTKDSENVFLEEFIALAEGKTSFRSEASIFNLKGEVLDVLFNLNVLPGHEETLSLVLVSVVDVTHAKKMEHELSRMKHRYQSIVEAQNEMICRVGPKGKILFRNVAFTRFFGFKDKGEGVRFVSLFPPDELEKCERELNRLSASEPQVILELRNYDATGTLVWQEWSITSFFGTSGVLLGYQAVGTDVTARKIAQEALAASEARWRSVFEHADDLILTVNTDGYILSINDFQGLPKDKRFAGRTIEEVLPKDDAIAVRELLNAVAVNAAPIKTEIDIDLNGDGRKTMFGLAMSPILHGKRVISIICIARDITEMKRLENQTKEALIEGQENERMRVSQELHDGLGQLFTAIKLNLQQIRSNMGECLDGGLVEGMNQLESNIGIAFDEVRNISRNLMPDVLRQFGLKPAVEDLVDKWNSTSEVRILLEMVDMDQRFSNDLEKALFRICQELINNSARHAQCSNIYVQFINHGTSLVLSVEDDGVGFDTSERTKGFGLKNIISRAQVFAGTVEIDSAAGQGTVTTIEIPLSSNTDHDKSSDS